MFKLFKKDIFNLFVSPNKIRYIDFSKNLKVILCYYFIFTVLLLLFSIIISSLKQFFGSEPKLFVNKEIQFFEVVLIVPVLEEILFRLMLRVNKFNLLIFSIWVFIFILYKNFALNITSLIVLCLLFFLLFSLKNNKSKLNLSKHESRFFPLSFLLYLSCFLFGAIHLLNFDSLDILNITIILYMISKVVAGFVFALLRLKFGIFSSIIFHVFLNSLAYYLIS